MSGQRCTAETKAGRRCRSWAVRGSEQRCGEARCIRHGGGGPRGATLPRIKDLAGQSAPLGNSGGLLVTGARLYNTFFSDDELAALAANQEAQRSLEGEIAYARVFLRRLLAAASAYPDLTLAELAELTPAVSTLLRTVGFLVDKEQAAGDKGDDPMQALMGEVLAELGEEWGLELLDGG